MRNKGYPRQGRPWPGVPREGSDGTGPLPVRRKPPVPEPIETEEGCYRDSALNRGANWPIKGGQVFTLASGEQAAFNVYREVPVTLYVTVFNAGTLDLYVAGLGQRVGTDLPHFRFAHDIIPCEVVLPPGDHRFIVYANGALQAAIVPIERIGR